MKNNEKVLEAKSLVKWFPLSRGFFTTLRSGKEVWVRAVDDINFSVYKKDIFVLAGESGCGKTTTGKTAIRLLEPTSGKVYYKGNDLFALKERDLKTYRKRMQIIFQDPYESLNPRLNIYDTIAEPLKINKVFN
ncbi:MAG: ATP-binding cassette domain-containing protein, partial [Candidatus Bathyarchaeota archaeon]